MPHADSRLYDAACSTQCIGQIHHSRSTRASWLNLAKLELWPGDRHPYSTIHVAFVALPVVVVALPAACDDILPSFVLPQPRASGLADVFLLFSVVGLLLEISPVGGVLLEVLHRHTGGAQQRGFFWGSHAVQQIRWSSGLLVLLK